MLTQSAPDKKKEHPLIVNKTSEGSVLELLANPEWELDISPMTPTWIPGDLWVACYREGQNYFIGVFDLLNKRHVATLDFDTLRPSFTNPDTREYFSIPKPRVIPMTKTNHFVIAYQSGHALILKRWDSKTFICDKTFYLSRHLPHSYIDIPTMISINDILFFNRSERDCLFPDGRYVYSLCSLDLSFLNVKFDDVLDLGEGPAPYMRSSHSLGKNGLIASVGRYEVDVFDTNSRTVCATYPISGERVVTSPSSEHYCLFNSYRDHFTLVTLEQTDKSQQRRASGKTIFLRGNGNTLQDLYWSEEGYLVALIRDASLKNYWLQVINVVPDLTNNPHFPNRISFEFGQVIDTFASPVRAVFFDERICVFIDSSEKPGKVESFQTYSLTVRQKLQNLSQAVWGSNPDTLPKGVCDIIARYAYGRMFSSVSEAKPAPSQLQLRRQP